MVAPVRRVVPAFVRRRYALKVTLLLLLLGLGTALVGVVSAELYDFSYRFAYNFAVGGLLIVVAAGGVSAWSLSKSLAAVRERTRQIGDGEFEAHLETDRVDGVGALTDELERTATSLADELEDVRQARAEAERIESEADRFREHLETSVERYRRTLEACADGDLGARLDPDDEDESLATLAEAVNETLEAFESTIASATGHSAAIDTSSAAVLAETERARESNARVENTIEDIAAGADRQHERLESVTDELEGLSTTVEEIAAASNDVADIAERTAEAGDRGRRAAQEAIDGMAEIEAESETAVEEIDRLEAEMEQIDELIEFITQIADQTNMLALNANIEAARSGSSGEGFSVVAGEVKELSEETKHAAEDIEARLGRIQEQTDRTVAEVQVTSSQVSEHADSVERAMEALEDIATYAQETNDGVQEISAASQEQATSSEEIVGTVEDVAAIAERTNRDSETVVEAVRDQASALASVSESAVDLESHAESLAVDLERLDVDVDVPDHAVEPADTEPERAFDAGGEDSPAGVSFDFESDADSSGAGTFDPSLDRGEPSGERDGVGTDAQADVTKDASTSAIDSEFGSAGPVAGPSESDETPANNSTADQASAADAVEETPTTGADHARIDDDSTPADGDAPVDGLEESGGGDEGDEGDELDQEPRSRPKPADVDLSSSAEEPTDQRTPDERADDATASPPPGSSDASADESAAPGASDEPAGEDGSAEAIELPGASIPDDAEGGEASDPSDGSTLETGEEPISLGEPPESPPVSVDDPEDERGESVGPEGEAERGDAADDDAELQWEADAESWIDDLAEDSWDEELEGSLEDDDSPAPSANDGWAFVADDEESVVDDEVEDLLDDAWEDVEAAADDEWETADARLDANALEDVNPDGGESIEDQLEADVFAAEPVEEESNESADADGRED